MNKQYTISQLAKSAGIPTTTVRYYERIGLVTPEDRSRGNYRLYGNESLRKVKFIRAAQATGFTLGDIKSLLGFHGGKTPSCSEVQTLISERLDDIETRLRELRHVKRVLSSTLVRCRENDNTQDVCQALITLDRSSR